jgi:hypothetical protein
MLTALMLGCSSGIKTTSETSKGAELKNYKTYAWMKPENPDDESRKDDKMYSGLILQLANAELEKKGFKLDAENPDALFAFDTKVEERIKHTQNAYAGPGFGGPGYYGGYYYGPVSGGQFVAHETTQGMLFIEMYDTKSKKMLWSGSAQKELTRKSNVESDIKKAVKDIFIRLPVKHK